jgi:hypothetical protein
LSDRHVVEEQGSQFIDQPCSFGPSLKTELRKCLDESCELCIRRFTSKNHLEGERSLNGTECRGQPLQDFVQMFVFFGFSNLSNFDGCPFLLTLSDLEVRYPIAHWLEQFDLHVRKSGTQQVNPCEFGISAWVPFAELIEELLVS